MQKYGDEWFPVQFVSRSLNEAEKNYSQIEREALSVIFTCERFRNFLLGSVFIIKNDHKPLKKLFGNDSAIPVNCSSRLQRWALRLSQFNYTFEYIKGCDNIHADFLSRLPLKETVGINEPYELIFVVDALDELPINCDHIRKYTDADNDLVKLKGYIRNGFPNKLDLSLSKFKNVSNELSIMKGCIMYKDRVFVPEAIRESVLKLFHEGHPGICAMKQLARSLVWFHGMDDKIAKIVQSCNVCQNNRSKPAQKYLEWPTPYKKWSRIHIDHFFFEDRTFLVIVDAYTKYIECLLVNSTSSQCTIDALREVFSRQGLPDTLVSDNATSFSSNEFKTFLKQNVIHQMFSPPYSPSSNGLGERAVRVMKDLLRKNKVGTIKTRLSSVLLYYRSTPHSITKMSPSASLNNRNLVTLKSRINPNFVPIVREEKNMLIRRFNIGDTVLALNVCSGAKWLRGTITNICGQNIYEIFIEELQTRWIRHANQLLSRVQLNNNKGNNVDEQNDIDLDSYVCVSNDPVSREAVSNNHQMEPRNMNDQSMVLRRSTRVCRPPDRLNL